MFRVLIIEDHAGIRDMLRVLLESQHYRVVEAETAARGIIEARNHRPDLAIVDLGLPDREDVYKRQARARTRASNSGVLNGLAK